MVSGLKGRREQTATLPARLNPPALDVRAVLLFDIDGVIRDVGNSYRRAIVETVHHYSGWRPDPAAIDALKSEGRWNNDWEASLELLRRHAVSGGAPRPAAPGAEAAVRRSPEAAIAPGGPWASEAAEISEPQAPPALPAGVVSGEEPSLSLPSLAALAEVFGSFYFGGDPAGDPSAWRGFIGEEPLLVERAFFERLTAQGILWGFVSGAEPPSARFVLERRLGLSDPPLIAMGDAPDKPDPQGFLALAARLLQAQGGGGLGAEAPLVAYLGDTVADVTTVQRARRVLPQQRFWSLAVAPPHLQTPERAADRRRYEARLLEAGADRILGHTAAVLEHLDALLRLG